jgi:putative flippase GtrA
MIDFSKPRFWLIGLLDTVSGNFMAYINSIYYRFRNIFSRIWPKFFNYCEDHKLVVKFLLTGSLAGGMDLLVLFILHELFGINIIISTSIAFIAAFLISFSVQKLWTFRNRGQNKLARQLTLYIINAFISLSLNGLAMHYLVNNLNFWYLLAQVIVNLVLVIVNFIIYKYLIFKIDNNENQSS